MNKLSKPASNCRTAKLTKMHGNAIRALSIVHAGAVRVVCLYTNDLARAAKTCQALSRLKKHRCRIKTQLPSAPVHKSGKPFRCGTASLHACMQTVSSQGLKRCLQRSIGVEPAA